MEVETRKELKKYLNKTVKIEATFILNTMDRWNKNQVTLLRDLYLVDDDGQKVLISDHMWVYKKENTFNNLEKEDKITFRGRVYMYTKVRDNKKVEDYAISNIICIIKK